MIAATLPVLVHVAPLPVHGPLLPPLACIVRQGHAWAFGSSAPHPASTCGVVHVVVLCMCCSGGWFLLVGLCACWLHMVRLCGFGGCVCMSHGVLGGGLPHGTFKPR